MAEALQPYVAFNIDFYGGTMLKCKTLTLSQWCENSGQQPSQLLMK